ALDPRSRRQRGRALRAALMQRPAARASRQSGMGGLREDFAALAAAGDRTDLARAALAIARIAYPDLDPAPYLRQLDDLAAAVRPSWTRSAAAARSAGASCSRAIAPSSAATRPRCRPTRSPPPARRPS